MLTVYNNALAYNTDGYEIAYGHYYLDNMDYILFLREPYQQQLSYYNYTKQYKDMPDVDEYFKSEPSTMLRFLPPLDGVEFVGIYERYDEDIKKLTDYLGKEYIEPQKINVSKHKHIPNREAIKIFKKNNEYIYELYNNYL